MVTGVYHPEINGAVLQCKQLINNLRNHIDFTVLSGAGSKELATKGEVNGIGVQRFHLRKNNYLLYLFDITILTLSFIKIAVKVNVVHIHGFSPRNCLLIALARVLGKKIVLKCTSFGQDDPSTVKVQSGLSWFFYKRCHAYIGINPAFEKSYVQSGLPIEKYNFIPNCVDLNRFMPASDESRRQLRINLGFNENEIIVLFVGHFSKDKNPRLLYDAWLTLINNDTMPRLIFIGRTLNDGFEVDSSISQEIRADAEKRGISSLISFVEHTDEIEKYYSIADIFVLPSLREGMPNALLEAMAAGLPSIVTRLPDVTDWLVDEYNTGIMLESNTVDCLARDLSYLIENHSARKRIGNAARESVHKKFNCQIQYALIMKLYSKLGFVKQ